MTAAQIAEREAWMVQRSRFIRLMHELAKRNILPRSTMSGVSAWPKWEEFVAAMFPEWGSVHEMCAADFTMFNDEIAHHFGLFSGAER